MDPYFADRRNPLDHLPHFAHSSFNTRGWHTTPCRHQEVAQDCHPHTQECPDGCQHVGINDQAFSWNIKEDQRAQQKGNNAANTQNAKP